MDVLLMYSMMRVFDVCPPSSCVRASLHMLLLSQHREPTDCLHHTPRPPQTAEPGSPNASLGVSNLRSALRSN